ncbi:MAG: outer rane beta-barrel protein [Flavipsychrobacter sp.]|nr:outer rane beta-barrel protein [Flavipsychrobacter sp.]
MNTRIFLAAILTSSLFSSSIFAQDPPPENQEQQSKQRKPDRQESKIPTTATNKKFLVRHQDIRKFYVAGAMDGAIFSTAIIHHDGGTTPTGENMPNVNTMGIMRFTYFINGGFTFNFNFSPTVGLYTGVDIKNIGYIEQDNGWTTKRRTYNVGAPLALKVGNMGDRGTYFFAGGGLDVAINFQEKRFKERNDKTRINEWMSDRTPRTMPYVFAGVSFDHHITAKVQYYPNNYLNTNYRDQNGVAIYQGTNVNLIMLSVGFGMNVHVNKDKKKHKHGCHHCPAGCNDNKQELSVTL